MFFRTQRRPFPITLKSGDVDYAMNEAAVSRAMLQTGMSPEIVLATRDWAISLSNNDTETQQFCSLMAKRIQKDFTVIEDISDRPDRDLSEAEAMITAITLMYASFFSRLGYLPPLTNQVLFEYFDTSSNFGMFAHQRFITRLTVFDNLGLLCVQNVNKAGARSAGRLLSRTYIDILLDAVVKAYT